MNVLKVIGKTIAPTIISHFLNWECGQLFVRIERASEVSLRTIQDCSSYYCIVQVNKQERRTSEVPLTRPDPVEIVWSEALFFDVFDMQDILLISVWGKKIVGARFIGQFTIPVQDLADGIPLFQEFPLQKGTGRLLLKLNYTGVVPGKKISVDDFRYMKVLGKGTYGKVMLAQKIDSGQLFAVKVLRKDIIIANDSIEDAMTERDILIRVKAHPFIVSIRYCFQTEKKLYIVMDYIAGGELFFHLMRSGTFTEEQSRFYAAQLVLVFGFLHHMNIIYRDLKLENVLIDLHGYLVLTDFGLAKELARPDEKDYTVCGSRPYNAPEMLDEKGYGKEVDWWALGILLYEMISGQTPFFDEKDDAIIENIVSKRLTFDPNVFSPSCISLLSGLLEKDPEKRLGRGESDAEAIKSHPFFASIDWQLLYEKKLDPPYRPHLLNSLDVRYFDKTFTSEAPSDSYVESPWVPNSYEQDKFKGFSYVPEDEHMARMRARKLKNSGRIKTKLAPWQGSDSDSDNDMNASPAIARSERNMLNDSSSGIMLHETDLIEF